MKEQKNKVKLFTERCNAAKKDLDQVKFRLDQKAEEKRLTMQEEMMGYDEDDMEGEMQGDGSGMMQ